MANLVKSAEIDNRGTKLSSYLQSPRTATNFFDIYLRFVRSIARKEQSHPDSLSKLG